MWHLWPQLFSNQLNNEPMYSLNLWKSYPIHIWMSTIQGQKSGHGIPLYLSFHEVVYFVLFFRHTSWLSHHLISIDTVQDFLNTKSMQQNFYYGYLECKTFRYQFQYANKKFRYVLGDCEKYFLQKQHIFWRLAHRSKC